MTRDSRRVWRAEVPLPVVRWAIELGVLDRCWTVLQWREDSALCEFWCSRLQARESMGVTACE